MIDQRIFRSKKQAPADRIELTEADVASNARCAFDPPKQPVQLFTIHLSDLLSRSSSSALYEKNMSKQAPICDSFSNKHSENYE